MAASLGPDGLTGSSGQVLQVKSTILTGPVSANNDDADGTGAFLGLEVSITPKSSNSQFFIQCHVGVGTTTTGNSWGLILVRDSTRIGNGAAASGHRGGVWAKSIDRAGNNGTDANHGVGLAAFYLDTTSGTAGVTRTYKARGVGESGNISLNRVESDYSGSAEVVSARTSSTFTVWEIEK